MITMNYDRYADLTVRSGVNVQPGQDVVITCPVDCAGFARALGRAAYRAGAREVVTLWSDEILTRCKYEYAGIEVLEQIPDWFVQSRLYYAERGGCFINVYAGNPDAYAGIDPEKLKAAALASNRAFEKYYAYTTTNRCSWCIVAAPVEVWAKKVFPEAEPAKACMLLSEAIEKAMRLNIPDPVEAWKRHNETIRQRCAYLNQKQYSRLHYRSANGTDFKVGMPKGHIWLGGAEKTQSGVEFSANMPTEEIFSAPDRHTAEGTVVSSLPLCYNGSLIEEFSITFQNGVVSGYEARRGKELLQQIIETDDGARRLGEIALVQKDSPISNMGILFYNTLFDENASCHFALGKAYPSCIENGLACETEALLERGVNDSLTHVDFMVGTEDLEITGYTEDNRAEPIFRGGNFVI